MKREEEEREGGWGVSRYAPSVRRVLRCVKAETAYGAQSTPDGAQFHFHFHDHSILFQFCVIHVKVVSFHFISSHLISFLISHFHLHFPNFSLMHVKATVV